MCSLSHCVFFLVGVVASLSAQADPPKLQQEPDAARLYGLAAREAQYQALSAIPEAEVKYGKYGRLRQLDGNTGIRVADATKLKRGDSAGPIFQKLKHVLLANGAESLVVHQAGRSPIGTSHFVVTDQVIDGIPVIDARVNILVDPSGEILMVNSLFVPQGKASRTPQISLQAARAKLTQTLVDPAQVDKGSAQVSTAGSLAFWTDGGNEETPILLWMIDATISRQGESQTVTLFWYGRARRSHTTL